MSSFIPVAFLSSGSGEADFHSLNTQKEEQADRTDSNNPGVHEVGVNPEGHCEKDVGFGHTEPVMGNGQSQPVLSSCTYKCPLRIKRR